MDNGSKSLKDLHEEASAAKPVREWFLYYGGISGQWPDGKSRRTSKLVARDEDIVTTASGSKYRLVEPPPDAEDLKRLDSIIKLNNATRQ